MLLSAFRGAARGVAPLLRGPSAPLAVGRTLATITYSPPVAKIGQPAPTFKDVGAVVENEITTVSLDQYKGSWVCLLFYPKAFTYVCPTEIIAFSEAAERFAKVHCKVLAISCDSPEVKLAWSRTPRKRGGLGHMQIPLVADLTKSMSADYGVLIEELGIPLRGLFLIDPQGILQQAVVNNLPVGRDVDETIRLLQAYQFVAEHGEVCPAGWKPGAKSMKADPENSLEYFSQVDEEADTIPVGPKIKVAKSKKEFDELIKGKKAVAAFGAGYCGKCRQIQPLVDQLSEQYGDVTFVKVDTTEDALTEVVSSLGVSALPAFHFFKGGKATGKPVIGYKKTPLKEAVATLAKS